MSASRPRLTPISIPSASAWATSSDRMGFVAPAAAPVPVDRMGPGCCSVVLLTTAAGHENLWRYQFGQLSESEMGLRQARAALQLGRHRHAEARNRHHAISQAPQ